MVAKLEKSLAWIGSSKKDLMSLPIEVRKFFGHALDFAQNGEQHSAAKVLKGFSGAGVLEVVENDQGGTYRAVYTVKEPLNKSSVERVAGKIGMIARRATQVVAGLVGQGTQRSKRQILPQP